MKITLENKIVIGFFLSLLILIFIAIVSFLCIVDLADDASRTKRSQEVITQLASLLSTTTDAETAHRGYIITGNEKFLDHYKQAGPEISKLCQNLKELASQDYYQLKEIKTLELLIARRLAMIRFQIEMRRTEGFDKVEKEIATGKGKQLQDNIRAEVAKIQLEENRKQVRLKQDSMQSIQFTKFVIISGSFLAILFVFMALLLIRRGFVDRRLAEQQIRMKNEELLKINSEKDKFFSIIAHDLRSPFNGFLGLTQLMVDDLSSLTQDEIQEIASALRKSATNLFNLLENLLEWTLLEQGLIPFRGEEFQLISIVNESIKILNEAARKKEIKIACAISGDIVVFADRNMLQTIIRNLVSNALKFTAIGGKILISTKPIEGNKVEISVQDSGVGMKKEILDNLFKPDVNTSRPGTNGEPSTGLGLMLCKEFVEKHGGKIRVESEENRGSAFYFTIQAKG